MVLEVLYAAINATRGTARIMHSGIEVALNKSPNTAQESNLWDPESEVDSTTGLKGSRLKVMGRYFNVWYFCTTQHLNWSEHCY